MPSAISVVRGGAVAASEPVHTCEASGLRMTWRGFVYMAGHPAGPPSIARFAAEVARAGAAEAAAGLRGSYVLAVEAGEETYVLVDASGYFHAFWSAEGAGDDFLALARAGRLTAADLDPEAVAELITQGQVAFGRTPFASIRRIGPEEIVVVPREGAPRSIPKRLPALDEPPPLGFMAQLERLAPSLEGHRISLDLTGGLDSRLLAVALARLGVGFETVTGGRPESGEVRLAGRVAAALGCAHHVTEHRPEALPSELDELLLATGCLVNPLVHHRELQLQRSRTERGIDLTIHGLGGEGFKDFFWQQDFPLYAGPVRPGDLDRLWRLRIERPQARTAPLAGEHAAAAAALKARYIERLEAYRMPLKTQTYDNIFLRVRGRDVNGRGLTLRNGVIANHAPLLDRDAQRLAFSLPRRTRIFNGFHRRVITRLAPDVARIPTTDGGMSASSAAPAIPLDAVRWSGSRAWRLAKKTAPARMRPLPVESPLPPLLRLLRTMPVLDASVAELCAAGVFTAGTAQAQLADGHLGGTVALARLIRELG